MQNTYLVGTAADSAGPAFLSVAGQCENTSLLCNAQAFQLSCGCTLGARGGRFLLVRVITGFTSPTMTASRSGLNSPACPLFCRVQVTGKNPLAALQEHLADPWGTTIFSKAVVVPGQMVQPECKIPQFTEFQGTKIFTPCLFQGLWP